MKVFSGRSWAASLMGVAGLSITLLNIHILGSDEMQSASYIQNYGLKNMIQHCLNMHLNQGWGSVGSPLLLGHLGMAPGPWVKGM